MNSTMTTDICKALSSPVRLEILQQLASGEKCACHLLESFSITQPTLSHHMRVLCDCNLVQDRKEGKWHYYTLKSETLSQFGSLFTDLGQTAKRHTAIHDRCENGGDTNE